MRKRTIITIFLIPCGMIISLGLWISLAHVTTYSLRAPKISPDSNYKGFVYQQVTTRGIHGKIIELNTWLRWHNVKQPEENREIDLTPFFPEDEWMDLFFSPDSQQMAVVTPSKIIFVETETGDYREFSIPGEKITSFAWQSPTVFGYGTAKELQFRSRIWIQDMTSSAYLSGEVHGRGTVGWAWGLQ